MSISWLCYLAAAVIFFLEFFTTALDSTFLYCGLGLVAAGLALGGVSLPVGLTKRSD
jgi:hypothetical protein